MRQQRIAALIVKEDFEKAEHDDKIQSIYTNRSKLSQITYAAGEKLHQSINSYINSIGNLPTIENIVYPDLQQLVDLSIWLKTHSIFIPDNVNVIL